MTSSTSIEIPEPSDPRMLRHLHLPGCGYLLVWDTYRLVPGGTARFWLGYAYWHGTDPAPIFTGEDIGTGAGDAIDSDDAIRGVLTFLSLRPGDTDAEYFSDYTAEQLDWAQCHAEALAMYALPLDDGGVDLHQFDVP